VHEVVEELVRVALVRARHGVQELGVLRVRDLVDTDLERLLHATKKPIDVFAVLRIAHLRDGDVHAGGRGRGPKGCERDSGE
jgi:hypothetical protein